MFKSLKLLPAIFLIGFTIYQTVGVIRKFSEKRLLPVVQVNYPAPVVVNAQKLKVRDLILKANVRVEARTILELILLTDSDTGNVLSGICKIMTGMIGLSLLFKLNLKNPFDRASYRKVNLIIGLLLLNYFLENIGGRYSEKWFNDHFHPAFTDPHYIGPDGNLLILFLFFTLAKLASDFYQLATYNQQQQELTV